MKATFPNPSHSLFSRSWPALLVAAVAFGVFANSFNNEFVYDDIVLIVHNPYIRSWSNLWDLLNPTSTFNRTLEILSYRPLLNLSYLVTYMLFGLNAGGHHVFNVTLHALNALLVFVVLRRLSRSETVALVAGLAFAVHPIHMEAVQVSAIRMDLLATPLFIAALLFHLRLRDRPGGSPVLWASLAVVSFFLACTGKEIGATMPLVALFLDIRRDRTKALLSREGMAPYVGYAAAFAFYAWLRFGLFTNIHQGETYLGGSLLTALLTTGRIFVAYLGHLLLPLNIRADYVITPSSGLDAASAGSWAVLVSLGVLAWLVRRRHPTLTLGLVWLGATLLPVANLVPIRNPMADRYLYLPSVGYCLVVGWAMVEGRRTVKERWGASAGGAVAALCAIVFIAWGAITWKQNTIWRSSKTLWSETLRLEPNSFKAHYNLGIVYETQGLSEQAEASYRRALNLRPTSYWAYFKLGLLYHKRGFTEQAKATYRGALRLRPTSAAVLNNLGLLLASEGNFNEAAAVFRKAIAANSTYAKAHYNLGVAYESQGLAEQAEAAYRRAVQLEPTSAKALNNWGGLLVSEGKYPEAEPTFRRALAVEPNYTLAHLNLANLYLNHLGAPEKAIPHLEAVITLEPENARTEELRSLVRKLKQ